ncbi:hypothetical protein HDU93_003261 [Gonapodya sp. JEL0774]|nr:hypothetical protein HDU93_003261 [Gonapodya sp. JEL0774]
MTGNSSNSKKDSQEAPPAYTFTGPSATTTPAVVTDATTALSSTTSWASWTGEMLGKGIVATVQAGNAAYEHVKAHPEYSETAKTYGQKALDTASTVATSAKQQWDGHPEYASTLTSLGKQAADAGVKGLQFAGQAAQSASRQLDAHPEVKSSITTAATTAAQGVRTGITVVQQTYRDNPEIGQKLGEAGRAVASAAAVTATAVGRVGTFLNI